MKQNQILMLVGVFILGIFVYNIFIGNCSCKLNEGMVNESPPESEPESPEPESLGCLQHCRRNLSDPDINRGGSIDLCCRHNCKHHTEDDGYFVPAFCRIGFNDDCPNGQECKSYNDYHDNHYNFDIGDVNDITNKYNRLKNQWPAGCSHHRDNVCTQNVHADENGGPNQGFCVTTYHHCKENP
tara:strand:- start:3155 stop:3706 length:552 start_codon:yes stop_codon:yes gene_type:complete